MKIKIFVENSPQRLEESINEFLASEKYLSIIDGETTVFSENGKTFFMYTAQYYVREDLDGDDFEDNDHLPFEDPNKTEC
jgi:hypothetical protein